MRTIHIQLGDVKKKKIITTNDFVSHMIEHIAWRLGLSIDLTWEGEDWQALGKALGSKIAAFQARAKSTAALGMIDDGSAEVSIEFGTPKVQFAAFKGVDLKWFLRSRCEQIETGESLVELLRGLSEGLSANISITIGNMEDPHHTWEGIFRAVGIALSRVYTPTDLQGEKRKELAHDTSRAPKGPKGEIQVLERSLNKSTVRRGTAESGVTVTVDFSRKTANEWKIGVADSILDAVKDIPKLFEAFTESAGFAMSVDFKATVLSSSHVVFEDVGMVAGRALLEILKLRMENYGVNGAGSTVLIPEDIKSNEVNVAISVEGRKCWRFVSTDGDEKAMTQKFLIGQNVCGGLRSEDLDDFIDGLTGGMTASVMVHLKDYSNPDRVWREVFKGLGKALKEVFDVNPYRKGVPPGVKATLA